MACSPPSSASWERGHHSGFELTEVKVGVKRHSEGDLTERMELAIPLYDHANVHCPAAAYTGHGGEGNCDQRQED